MNFFWLLVALLFCKSPTINSNSCDPKSKNFSKLLIANFLIGTNQYCNQDIGKLRPQPKTNSPVEQTPNQSQQTPTASLQTSRVNLNQVINFSSTTPQAVFCLTNDGQTPKCNSTNTGCQIGIAGSSLTITTNNNNIKLISCASGYTASNEFSASYYVPIIFVSNTTTNGNTTDSAGDAICNADLNKPSGIIKPYTPTYKMMRRSPTRFHPNTDWPFYPNQDYFNTSNQHMLMTNVNAIYPIGSNLNNPPLPVGDYWTAIGNPNLWSYDSTFSCTDWTTTAGNGTYASGGIGASFMYQSQGSCGTPRKLLCIEQ